MISDDGSYSFPKKESVFCFFFSSEPVKPTKVLSGTKNRDLA